MLELSYYNENIFLEGTFMVVTAIRKRRDFLELTPSAESRTLFGLKPQHREDVNLVFL